MTRVLLIRHALTDAVGRTITGRAPAVHLNAAGREQARRLDERLAGVVLRAVYASPLERAVETAEPLVRRRGLEVQPLDGVNELAYGDWTGRDLAELADDAAWRRFNAHRSRTRIPGGELAVETQARAVAAIEAAAEAHAGTTIAIVTHADVIRVVVAYYAGIPLDLALRLEFSPAAVSTVELGTGEPRILAVNEGG
jgi:probable phosphomutase (TIGR03848 family)